MIPLVDVSASTFSNGFARAQVTRVLARSHLFLEDIFPHSIGKPIFRTEHIMRKLFSAIILLTGTVLATPAWAHAHLVGAEPPVDGATTPTATLRITFSEGIEIKFSKVEVTMDDGMDMGPAKITLDPNDPKVLVVTLPTRLDPGSYKVNWQVVSVDSHKTQGGYRFSVKP